MIGSFPTGYLVGRLRGVDLRQHGSRNIGATNAFRVLGARWGALVFLIDMLKGWYAFIFPSAAGGMTEVLLWTRLDGHLSNLLSVRLGLIAGVAAILGHMYTPWLRFRGGRGVATSLGVFLAVVPWPTLLAFLLWGLLLVVSKRVSVGSIVAAFVFPFLVYFLGPLQERALLTTVAGFVAALVILRHIPNIKRILSGTEPPTIRGSAPKAERT